SITAISPSWMKSSPRSKPSSPTGLNRITPCADYAQLLRTLCLELCWLVFIIMISTLKARPGQPQDQSRNRRPVQTAGSDVPKIDFEKYTLPNGLQVILHVDHKLPMVHVNNWYHVGSKNERLGRSGFAHLFEHMMFEGSKDANGKYVSFMERAGANVFEGGVNGTTSPDRTNYFESVPSGSLEYVLWLESDRLATLADVLTREKLDNERNIVK